MKWQLAMVMAAMVAGCGGGGGDAQTDLGMTEDGSLTETDMGGEPGALCGNGTLDPSEPCDGSLLDGATCMSEGFAGGTLTCLPDCRGLNTTVCTVDPVAETVTPVAPLAIVDNAYDGTIASMSCLDVVIDEGTRGFVNNEAFSVRLTMDHTFVGDLVVKLVAPSGHVSTLMHRPGVISPMDNGDLAGGNSANLVSTHPITLARGIGGFNSESIGNNLTTAQAPCRDNIYCNYVASSVVGPDEIEREPVAGTWRVCVGDAAMGDTGTITAVELNLMTTTQPEAAILAGEVLQTAIADGAFDGTLASMTCKSFDMTYLDAVHTNMTIISQFGIVHPNVGDLVFAIVGPDGELHALAVRPGTDEAADGSSSDPGASANLTASPRPYIHLGGLLPSYPSAELMGDGVGTEELVCNPDSSCNFNSSEGNLDWPSASALLGAEAAGTYQLCVGDAREGDVGTFEYAVLSLELTP